MRKKLVVAGLITVMVASGLYGCGCSKSENSSGNESNIAENNGGTGNTGSTGSSLGNSGNNNSSTATGTKFDITSESVKENEVTVAVSTDGVLSGEGADVTVESTKDNTIYLDGDSIRSEASGVSTDGGTITITKAGTYVVTGTLKDGQILVDTKDKETVWIILNGANISNGTNAPIYIVNAKKTILSAALGTENTLTDAKDYTYASAEDEEPNACVFSKDDLVLSGGGSLTVTGNFNNGIQSNDTLEINEITLSVTAKNNGIKGKDYLLIKAGDIRVEAEGDGLKSDNTSDTTLGYILIEGGTIDIHSGEDGIQAETCLKITGGDITIETGDGSGTVSTSNRWGGGNTSSDTSIKGIKAGVDITITGGNINIDSEDDAIHTNESIEIAGGDITVSSGDDGIHSDTKLVINGGTINVTKSYEGIESADITINDGYITVVASDDGINAAGGNDNSSQGGRPGMNMFSESSGYVEINGGYIYVNAAGDGLDSNTSINMTGGTVLIDGPEDNGNGAIDYESEFTMSGGLLVAAGSSGMMQAVSSTSTQNCIAAVFSSYQSGGTFLNISDSEGNDIITYRPSKKYNSVVVCSPDIKSGETYTVSSGGDSTGKDNGNGLYTGGSYSGGSEAGSVTVSSVVSTIGNAGGMPGGMPGGMNGGGQPDPGGNRPGGGMQNGGGFRR